MNRALLVLSALAIIIASCISPTPDAAGDAPAAATMPNTSTATIQPTHTSTATATEQSTPTPTNTATATNSPTPDPFAGLPPVPQDAACVIGRLGGLTCLGTEGWVNYPQEMLKGYINAITTCPERGLLFLGAGENGLLAFDGERWIRIPSPEFSGVWQILCDSQGHIWVNTDDRLSQFNGAEWIDFNPTLIFAHQSPVEWFELAPDRQGNLWAVLYQALFFFDGAAWELVSEWPEDEGVFSDIAVDSLSRPWLLGGIFPARTKELRVWDQGRWSKIVISGRDMTYRFFIDHQDQVWVGTEKGLLVYDGTGWVTHNINPHEGLSNYILQLAVDRQGRAWVATRYGLGVLEDSTWHHYHMHTADLQDNYLSSKIIVIGNGPQLPEPMIKPDGELVGHVTLDGQPLARIKVEICEYTLVVIMEDIAPPCEGSAFRKYVYTDSEGFFIIEAPTGYYKLLFQTPNGKEYALTDDDKRMTLVEIRPGQVTDIGRVDINAGN